MVKKAKLHKTWLEKHPKLAKTNCIGRWICLATTNCIGRWICLAILDEKLQWTSLSTTKMIHLETSSRILLIRITSQPTHHFGGKVNKDKKEVGKKFANVALYLHFCKPKKNAEVTSFTVHFELHTTKTCFLLTETQENWILYFERQIDISAKTT